MQKISLSIILPVMNEVNALQKTVEIIENENNDSVLEYIFIVCDQTIQESLDICLKYQQKDRQRFIIHKQTKPFLGNAIREGFSLAKAPYLITMGSDLETDPHDVKTMIEISTKNPQAIITASRWLAKNNFHGYGKSKVAFNFIFQQFLRALYQTKLSDLTYCYRLMPTKLCQEIKWQEQQHAFLLETILKPLRLKIPVVEFSSLWRERDEGESQNSLKKQLAYIRVAIGNRFK
jgi:glycosyltransferase involved in cell wall biosynthesis